MYCAFIVVCRTSSTSSYDLALHSAILRHERDHGRGMSLIVPDELVARNSRLWVSAREGFSNWLIYIYDNVSQCHLFGRPMVRSLMYTHANMLSERTHRNTFTRALARSELRHLFSATHSFAQSLSLDRLCAHVPTYSQNDSPACSHTYRLTCSLACSSAHFLAHSLNSSLAGLCTH